MHKIASDAPGPAAQITGKLQLIVSPMFSGFCVEDRTGNFTCAAARKMGNLHLIDPKSGPLVLKISQVAGQIKGEVSTERDVAALKYTVLAAKGHKDFRLCDSAAYGLEFDAAYRGDPENRTVDNSRRVVKFDLTGAENECYIGMFPNFENQAIRVYF